MNNIQKNKTKDQHILPRMFLNGFVNESDNIFMFDARKNKISNPRNVDSVAKQTNIYTVIKGQNKNYTIEEKFSEIESHNAPLLKKINATGFSDITQAEIQELIKFIVFLFIRTPRHTNVAEKVVKREQVLFKMLEVDPNAKMLVDACNESKGLAYALTLEGSFLHRLKALTDNFDLCLITSEEGSPPFIFNDMFCCLEILSSDTHYKYDNIDWGRMNVKKHFPVSNRHCVSFVPKKDKSKIGAPEIHYDKTIASKSYVQIINKLSFAQKERYAYCSQRETFENQIAG